MKKDNLAISDILLRKLSKMPVFENLSFQELSSVRSVNELHLLKDEIVFREGERYHRGIYLITNGKIKLSRSIDTKSVVRENDILGITTYLSKTMYSYSATAISDADVLFIPEVYIYKLFDSFPLFRHQFIDYITVKMREIKSQENSYIDHKFDKSVRYFIQSPIVSINISSDITDACRVMKEHDTDFIFVSNRKHSIKGILSKDSISKCFNANGENSKNIEIYIDSEPLILYANMPVDIALDEMVLNNKKYAVVTDSSKPIGLVSKDKLELAVIDNANHYSSNIFDLESIDQLEIAFKNIYKQTIRVLSSSRVAIEEMKSISSVHKAILQRAYQLSADEYYHRTNFHITDNRYAYITLGSSARGELDLIPRVSNAIILEDRSTDEYIRQMVAFSELYTSNLLRIGYLKGILYDSSLVMRESEWIEMINKWYYNPASDTRTSVFVLMDLDMLDGDYYLLKSVSQHINNKIKQKPSLLHHILVSAPSIRVPVSNFSGFILEHKSKLEKPTLNLYDNGTFYISRLTRLLSLYLQSSELSTIRRIESLKRHKILPESLADKAIYAYDTIFATLLNEQVCSASNGKPIGVSIIPSSLSLSYQEKLQRAFTYLNEYHNYVKSYIEAL